MARFKKREIVLEAEMALLVGLKLILAIFPGVVALKIVVQLI